MKHALLCLALVLPAPLALAADAPSGKQPFTAERSWQLLRIGNPELSPDGRSIVAPVSRTDMAENKASTDLWLWSADGGTQRALTSSSADESAPRFSPDGKIGRAHV